MTGAGWENGVGCGRWTGARSGAGVEWCSCGKGVGCLKTSGKGVGVDDPWWNSE